MRNIGIIKKHLICSVPVVVLLLILAGCSEVKEKTDYNILKNILILKEQGRNEELKFLLSSLDTTLLKQDMREIVAFEKSIRYQNSAEYLKNEGQWSYLLRAIYAKETQDDRQRIEYLNNFIFSRKDKVASPLLLLYTISLIYEKGLDKNYDLKILKDFFKDLDLDDLWLSTYYYGYKNLIEAVSLLEYGDYSITQLKLSKLFVELETTSEGFSHLKSILAYYIMNTAGNSGDSVLGDRYFDFTQVQGASKDAQERAILLRAYVDFYEHGNIPNVDIFDSFEYTCDLATAYAKEIKDDDVQPLTEKLIELVNVRILQPADMANLMQMKGSPELRLKLCNKLSQVTMPNEYVGFVGYQIEGIRNILEAKIQLCENGKAQECDSAGTILNDLLDLWLSSGFDKDAVHNSDFISHIGLTELAIYHAADHGDGARVMDLLSIHFRCKNRLLQRTKFLNQENYLSKSNKKRFDQLSLQYDQISNDLNKLGGEDFFYSSLHDQRLKAYINRKEILKYEDHRLIEASIIEATDPEEILSNVKMNEYQVLDLIYDYKYLYILSITPDTIISRQVALEDHWQSDIERFQSMVKDQHSHVDSIRSLGSSIWNRYFADIVDPSYQDLVIVNTGIFNNMPFCAMSIDSEKFLFEKFDISYIPNLSFTSTWKSEHIQLKNASLLSFTDRTTSSYVNNNQYPELNYGLKETSTLSKKIPLDDLVFISGKELTRDNFIRAMRSDFLHIATHASSSTNNQYGNYFVVRDGNNPEQLFGFELSPKAKLMVINSCESNIGSYLPGEGVFSITNQFLSSKSTNIVSTNFKINDQASEYFMELFYDEFLQGGDPRTAIRVAQKIMSRDDRYGHPKYWAAYSYHGNPTSRFKF